VTEVTDVTETNDLAAIVGDSSLAGVDTVREAVRLVEGGLQGVLDRELVSSSEVADLLLDLRSVLSRLESELVAG
jgi:hypothetical protein